MSKIDLEIDYGGESEKNVIIKSVSSCHPDIRSVDELSRCPVCGTVMRRNSISDASLTRTTTGTTGTRTITCVRCGHTEPIDTRNHKEEEFTKHIYVDRTSTLKEIDCAYADQCAAVNEVKAESIGIGTIETYKEMLDELLRIHILRCYAQRDAGKYNIENLPKIRQ